MFLSIRDAKINTGISAVDVFHKWSGSKHWDDQVGDAKLFWVVGIKKETIMNSKWTYSSRENRY